MTILRVQAPKRNHDDDAERSWSQAMDAAFQSLLDDLGGAWDRVDYEDWYASQSSERMTRTISLRAAEGARVAAVEIDAQCHWRHAERIGKLALFSSLPSFFGAIYLTHDVWRIAGIASIPIWVFAVAAPPVTVILFHRRVMRAPTRIASAHFEVEVRKALSRPDSLLSIV